jgi:hypothetical protein
MAHTSNPSYSRVRNQENLSRMPAWAKKSETLSQKYPTQKRASGEAQLLEC